MNLLQAILDTLEAPVEARRLQRCGLDSYTPKHVLQEELSRAHRLTNILSYLGIEERRQKRASDKRLYEEHWAAICWEYNRRIILATGDLNECY